MKIALPTAQGKLCMHFGHCEQFAIIEVDEKEKQIINTEMVTPPAHEPGVLPRWLHEQGANIIIAGGMGQRAQALFQENQIKVVTGGPGENPEKIVTDYVNGTLKPGVNSCDH